MLDAVIEFMPSPIDIPPVRRHHGDEKRSAVTRKADGEKFTRFGTADDRPTFGPAYFRALMFILAC
jgi:hypothetical protein